MVPVEKQGATVFWHSQDGHRARSLYGAALLCLGLLATVAPAFAADNGALVSETVPAGTQIEPRTIFNQTWTITNTGPTTWTATSAGYTLNMISKDSLGAIQQYPNTSSSRHILSAVIGSGKSVPPGGTAQFSMTFIAPEMSGSYTDLFQLNNASSVYFGPQFSIQISVPKAGSTNQYDRAMAVSYANNYTPYVVSDGYFWTNGSDYANLGPGAPVPTSVIGDDCAHFVSCCIGSQAAQRGAGLFIPSRASPTYGEPGATRLVTTVLMDCGFATEVYSLSNMAPGDLIGWNWEGDTNINDLDHVTLYVGNGLVCSHAQSALDVSASTYFQSGEPNWRWHLIHILDSPTLTSFVANKKMVMSWTTNWYGYNLYSATSLQPNATWTKMPGTPAVSGILNRMTNNVPTGAVFYRLMHP